MAPLAIWVGGRHQKTVFSSFYSNSRLLGLKLTGGCHPLSETDGWPATRATRSNEGPEVYYVSLAQEILEIEAIKVEPLKKESDLLRKLRVLLKYTKYH